MWATASGVPAHLPAARPDPGHGSSQIAISSSFQHSLGYLGRSIVRLGHGGDFHRGDGTRPCGIRTVGSVIATSSIDRPSDHFMPRWLTARCLGQESRFRRRNLLHRTSSPLRRCGAPFPTRGPDWRATSRSRCAQLHGSCSGGAVYVSACCDAGSNAGGGATVADLPPSGVCSPARGRGACETVPLHCSSNRSSQS